MFLATDKNAGPRYSLGAVAPIAGQERSDRFVSH